MAEKEQTHGLIQQLVSRFKNSKELTLDMCGKKF